MNDIFAIAYLNWQRSKIPRKRVAFMFRCDGKIFIFKPLDAFLNEPLEDPIDYRKVKNDIKDDMIFECD